MKGLWLAKLYLLLAHPSPCHIPVQFVRTKRQLIFLPKLGAVTAWLRCAGRYLLGMEKYIYHPNSESVSSAATTVSTAISTSASITSMVTVSASVITNPSLKSLPSSEEVPNELLVLPQPLPAKIGRRKKRSMTKLKK